MKEFHAYLWSTLLFSSLIGWTLYHLVGTGSFFLPVIALLIFISIQLNRLESKRNKNERAF
ncbi:hypothetical protein ACJA3J_20305 [Halobacillus sp. SY10]|uniref:hypothetical protein n=1 Tax=Halobacillus sp. SY10 TaxID=3381356 RepID=UPI0038799D0D